ncbi:DUF3826 domain-containing protein [Pedobacter sp. SYSU D00535]|uniref:DUF3826 domain-containing protein n=1 Tax=Pedobacter sp. SYSU D00535 TaxID=2810308 RepID=UPI001A965604|nr:DUF3826 domain-containing protein [Pedobacter sp. SYSU D00535]
MNSKGVIILLFVAVLSLSAKAQLSTTQKATPEQIANEEAAIYKNAAEWAASLQLNDAEKEQRIKALITTHLKAVHDWHYSHSYETVPAGINPATGKPLGPLDRQLIASSAMPGSVHETLMTGLRKDLTEQQVEQILDKYTKDKLASTLAKYKMIVPDLTAEEEKVILANLKQAREQSIDYKTVKLVIEIFEIYRTKNEQYLISKGRNWPQLYKKYIDIVEPPKETAKKR